MWRRPDADLRRLWCSQPGQPQVLLGLRRQARSRFDRWECCREAAGFSCSANATTTATATAAAAGAAQAADSAEIPVAATGEPGAAAA